MAEEPSLRILLVCHGLAPESVGGVEQHVDGLARALVAAGHKVHVLCKTGRAGPDQGQLRTDPPGPYAVTRVVYRYEGLSTLRSLYESPVIDAAVERFLDSVGPFDIAHVHHLTGLSVNLLEAFERRGIAVAITLHDYWMMCPRGQMWHRDGSCCRTLAPEVCADCLRPTFGAWVPAGDEGTRITAAIHERARAVLARPALRIVPSARALPAFEALGIGGDLFRVVENAVDTEALSRLAPPAAEPGRPLRVGYLGTLIPSKGLDVLVRALRRVSAGGDELELHIHGNAVPYHGDESYLTRVFAALNPTDRVTYYGPYQTGDLPAILSELDVVAAPALWQEAFGLTVREAIAAARPVVVSAIGGLQDAVRDGLDGFRVPPGDVGALSEILRQLAQDRGRVVAAATACRTGGRTRSFAEMAAELADLYLEVLG